MAKEFLIYCDESDKRGKFFSNFYGGALVSSLDLSLIKDTLAQKKIELNLFKEVKWSGITESYCDKYTQLMDCFFSFIRQNKIKIRVMFTQNINIADKLTDYHREYEYFILYYQFIKHIFGLRYANDASDILRVRVYFDRLPINTHEKVETFKSFIHGLSNSPAFRNARVFIPKDQIAEVDSKDHVILQCLDIVLGAIQFRLNNKHKDKEPGARKRGKRTIAKEKVYKCIQNYICQIYPGFNIGRSTSKGNDLTNIWQHPYRHWLFEPKESKVDLTKGKNPKKDKQ